MKLFNCRVRPSGWVNHEVPKTGLTLGEIALLRSIHGFAGVVGIEDAGMELKVKPATLRNILAETYGRKAVVRAFGRFGPLPERLEDLPTPDEDEEDAAEGAEVEVDEEGESEEAPVFNSFGAA